MKLCIDAGHGGNDPGAGFKGVKEKTVVLKIVNHMVTLLKHQRSIEVILSRPENKFVGLKERVKFANKRKADLFVSVHTNADADDDNPGDPEAEGKEVWHCVGSIKGLKLATSIGAGLRAEFPDEPWRGTKARNLYVVKRTKMPAVLVEVAFIDNSQSVLELQNPAVQKRIASAILFGVIGYWL